MLRPLQLAKVHLITDGIVVDPSVETAIGGANNLTLADYASTSGPSFAWKDEQGNEVWANAPIAQYNPNLVKNPAAVMIYDKSTGNFKMRPIEGHPLDRLIKEEWQLTKLALVPAYHGLFFPEDFSTRQGVRRERLDGVEGERRLRIAEISGDERRFTNYAITHTDRVRASPVQGCADDCHFCDLRAGGVLVYKKKPIERILTALEAALNDPVQPARHILISGGTPGKPDYEYENEVYAAVAERFGGRVDVDVMMVPKPGLLDPQRLKNCGVAGLSINMEIFDPDRAREVMPSKSRLGSQAYLDFIAQGVEVFGGQGKVRSLLLAGLESIDSTLAGIEALAQRGCDPVISPFRPDPATPLKNHPAPTSEFLIELYRRAEDIVSRYGVNLGPRCIPCMHNTITFPDKSGAYYSSQKKQSATEPATINPFSTSPRSLI